MPTWMKVWITVFVLGFLVMVSLRAADAYDSPLYIACLVIVFGSVLAVIVSGLIGMWAA